MDQGVSKLMENSEMSLENLCCNCSSAFLLSSGSGTLQEGSLSVASAHEHGLVETFEAGHNPTLAFYP